MTKNSKQKNNSLTEQSMTALFFIGTQMNTSNELFTVFIILEVLVVLGALLYPRAKGKNMNILSAIKGLFTKNEPISELLKAVEPATTKPTIKLKKRRAKQKFETFHFGTFTALRPFRVNNKFINRKLKPIGA